jgi:CheY-like chemotaxis protein
MDQNCSQKVVLIVEDEALVRFATVAQFRADGWTVLEAGGGEHAVLLLGANQQIDALVTDIQLEDLLTGWDVADAFRATDRGIPVIYASRNPSDPARRVADSVFFTKPCRTGHLGDACRMLTRERAMRV